MKRKIKGIKARFKKAGLDDLNLSFPCPSWSITNLSQIERLDKLANELGLELSYFRDGDKRIYRSQKMDGIALVLEHLRFDNRATLRLETKPMFWIKPNADSIKDKIVKKIKKEFPDTGFNTSRVDVKRDIILPKNTKLFDIIPNVHETGTHEVLSKSKPDVFFARNNPNDIHEITGMHIKYQKVVYKFYMKSHRVRSLYRSKRYKMNEAEYDYYRKAIQLDTHECLRIEISQLSTYTDYWHALTFEKEKNLESMCMLNLNHFNATHKIINKKTGELDSFISLAMFSRKERLKLKDIKKKSYERLPEDIRPIKLFQYESSPSKRFDFKHYFKKGGEDLAHRGLSDEDFMQYLAYIEEGYRKGMKKRHEKAYRFYVSQALFAQTETEEQKYIELAKEEKSSNYMIKPLRHLFEANDFEKSYDSLPRHENLPDELQALLA